jgi:hypothetical protein
MTTLRAEQPRAEAETREWLLDGDPAIRWQAMRDLTDTPEDIVARVRSRVALEGHGARLLALQRPDGQWGDGVIVPFWWTNLYTLIWLRDLGVEPSSQPVREAIGRVRENVTWGQELGHSPFFEGEAISPDRTRLAFQPR